MIHQVNGDILPGSKPGRTTVTMCRTFDLNKYFRANSKRKPRWH